MAYKFQLGAARLSGSTTFEESLAGLGALDITGLSSLDGGIDINGANFTAGTDGAVVATGLDVSTGAITNASTLALSGLASIASISMDDGSTLGPDSVSDLWTYSAAGDTTQKDGAYDFDLASHDGTNGLKLGGVLVTATAAELNILDGVTATAAELNYLDGADSDINTLVLPASTTISTFGASLVDDANAAAGLVTLGLSATAAELNYLDLTNAIGTAAASEAVVLDASKNIASINDISAAGLTLSDLTDNRLPLVGASGLLQDNAVFGYIDSRLDLDGYLALSVSSSASGSAYLADGALLVSAADDSDIFSVNGESAEFAVDLNVTAALSASGDFSIGGAVQLDGADASVGFVVEDSMYFFDADTNQMRRDSWTDVMSAAAGAGITATAGVLSVSAVSTPTAFGSYATLVEGLNYANVTLTGSTVVTLPDSDDLDVGESVKIKMAAGVSAANYASIVIKVDSGDLIDGEDSIVLESPYAAVGLFKVAANLWRIL